MITIEAKGGFPNIEGYLGRMKRADFAASLRKYGAQGVAALAAATPVDSGATAAGWSYKINGHGNRFSIVWTNSNHNNGVPIALLIQYGHGTGTGGYVPPRDYINPAIRPIFDQILAELMREVKR